MITTMYFLIKYKQVVVKKIDFNKENNTLLFGRPSVRVINRYIITYVVQSTLMRFTINSAPLKIVELMQK